jgi:hypothetical protein
MVALGRRKIPGFVLIVAAGLALAGWLSPGLQAQSPTEYEMKAVFLYNFVKFVEWPAGTFPDAGAPVIIGVAGNDSFREILIHTVEDKTAQGRKLLVRTWKKNDAGQHCQILFISSSMNNELGEILQNVNGKWVLTVGETAGFAQRGGIINFTLSDNKVGFEINHKSAEAAGLKVSSKLLTLAKIVLE